MNKYNININKLCYMALIVIATNNLNINCAAKPEVVLEERRQAIIGRSSSLTPLTATKSRSIDMALIQAIRGEMMGPKEIEILIKAGANVNAVSEDGRPTLLYATVYRNRAAFKLLLDAGADVNASDDGETALMRAAKIGDKAIAQLLIDKEANINAVDKHGKTALIGAAGTGNTDIAKLLLVAGCYIDETDEKGQKAIDYAHVEDSWHSEDVKENKRQVVKLIEEEPARRANIVKEWAQINAKNTKVAAEIGAVTGEYGLIPPLADLVSQYVVDINYEEIPLADRLRLSRDKQQAKE